jgi:nucleoside-diphosphate-sugar epimerase
MKTPSYERDPRVPGPLFYWDQQDLLFERGAQDGFGVTVLRPDFIIGIGLGSYTALFNSIAVYATVCKMQNLPLRYPGGLVGYNQLFQMTDAALLARASEWAVSRPHRDNEIFNVTNGDLIRLCNVWPRIAEYFELDLAPPLDINLELFMRDKAASWNALRDEQKLEVSFEELVDWNRNARVFTLPTEIHTSTIKIRKAGFEECLDSEDRLFELFDEMRQRRYIPTL